ncbi:hypothetical protein CK203_026287 [Vitis vinifera]|uniref:Uncharacterized protein n=1 Tax=Vitis vinifera TaxID=29760 RepID=A0A438ILA0_VITVI|nr:hypothetical protein CK203_026287 [Vitis vinifera]
MPFFLSWMNMKCSEGKLKMQPKSPYHCDLSSEEFVAFSDIERRNHPSIIKVYKYLTY